MLKIFIVDSQPVIHKAIQCMLAFEDDIAICGGDLEAQSAYQKILELSPHIVIMDIQLHNSSGVDLLQLIRSVLPKCAVIVFTQQIDGLSKKRALKSGVRAIVSKRDGVCKLKNEIMQVLEGLEFQNSTEMGGAV